MVGRQILLVEDNPGDAFLVREVLEERECGVSVAGDLAAAQQALREVRPDLIILDLNLPDSSGVATLHKVKAAAGKTPVVVLTGDVNPQTRVDAMAAGAEVLVNKNDTSGRGLVEVVDLAFTQHKITRTPTPLPSVAEINLATVMASLPFGVLVTDEEGRVLFANAKASTVLHREPDALMRDGFGPIPVRERFTTADIVRAGKEPHRVRLFSGNTAWNDRPARLVIVADDGDV